MFKRKIGYLGFVGFLGFFAFRFFSTHDIAHLSYLAYLGFFAYFWIAKIEVSIPDERYYEDAKTAKAFVGNVAVFEMIALFIIGTLLPTIRENLIVGISICFASLLIAYAVKLYNLEER